MYSHQALSLHDQPSHDLRTLSREVAELRVAEFEQKLVELLSDMSPEELVPVAARWIRDGAKDGMFADYPPHVLIHAIEACCAYWKQWKYKPFSDQRLIEVRNAIVAFEDPALARTLAPDSDLFDFLLFMHRTQIEPQGSTWWIPIGRFARLFGTEQITPSADASFRHRFKVSLQEWMQLSFAVLAGTLDRRCKFSHRYASEFPAIGVPGERVQAFLEEVSRSPDQIREEYLAVRRGRSDRKAEPPLAWSQRRPLLADYPLVRLARGYVVPSEAYAVDLFGESFFRRLIRDADEEVRREIGQRFEAYTADAARHLLPHATLWTKKELETPWGKSCDLALGLDDCTLLIELKAVVGDTNLVTRNAILSSGTMVRVTEGLEQVVRTAQRVHEGGYKDVGLSAGRPIYGVVATFGELAGYNHTAVWERSLENLGCMGIPRQLVDQVFADRPQVLHGVALELLFACLSSRAETIPSLFRQRREAPPHSIGDWQKVLTDTLNAQDAHNVDYWSSAGRGVIKDPRAIRDHA